MLGGPWSSVTELQNKFIEQLLKHVAKSEASYRPGAALLLGGVACRHVSARLFLASYGEWAGALLDALRRDTAPAARAACLLALAQLFGRIQELLDVPGVRRDASALAAKTMQVAQGMLGLEADKGGANGGCQSAALAAIAAVLRALPSVARSHATPLTAQLTAIMAAPPAAVHLDVRCAAARAVALLPRASATEAETWSATCRRTLISVHAVLDVLSYHGGAGGSDGAGGGVDGGVGARAREQLGAAEGLLAAAGPAGAAFAPGAAAGGQARPGVQHSLQVLTALLEALEALLAGGGGTPLPVPSHAVLLLVMRMLKLDAPTLLAPGRVAPSSSAQAEVLAALPALHRTAWQLLGLLCVLCGGVMLPLLLPACRLVNEHLRRIKAGGAGGLACSTQASVRTCLYGATVAVLRTGGLTAGRAIATEAVGALVTELYGLSAVQQQQLQTGLASTAGGGGRAGGPPAKKAKTAGGGAAAAGDPLAGLDAPAAAVVAAAVAPVAVLEDAAAQAAALHMLEVLLQVAGPALPVDTRSNLDALAMHMATVTTDAAVRVAREPGAAAAARAPEVATLRAAAARALVASVTSPLASRPPFLAQAVALLTAGADGGGGAEMAAVCQEGLLAVEALLRPRSAPITALYGSGTSMYGGNGVADGWGGSGSGASAGAAAFGQLPRPRMWSVLDPVAPVVVQVAAPAGAAPGGAKEVVAAAAPGTGGDVDMADAAAAAAAAMDGGRKAEAKGGAGAAKVQEEQGEGEEEQEEPEEKEATPAAAKGKGKEKGKGKGKEAAAAGGKGGAKVATQAATPAAGAKRQRGGEGAATPAAAAPVTAGKGGKAAAGKAGGSTAAAAAAKPAAGAAAAAASPAPPKPAVRAVPPPAPAAAVFGEESEDSEGSLPEIDSGSSSGDDE